MKHLPVRAAFILASVATLAGSALAQSVPVAPGGGGGGGGGGPYTTTTTVSVIGTIAAHNAGCCPNPIPCPPPAPAQVNYSVVLFQWLTLEQTQTFPTGLSAFFLYLTDDLGFSDAPYYHHATVSSTTATGTVTLGCGSQFKAVKTLTTTTNTEKQTWFDSQGNPSFEGVRTRKTEIQGIKSRIYGALQTWDPLTDVVSGPPCPPVTATPCESEDFDQF